MAVSCVPADLAAASKCFCFNDKNVEMGVVIYLLAQIAGNTMTPAQLADVSKCFCFPDTRTQSAVELYLLCQIVNAL